MHKSLTCTMVSKTTHIHTHIYIYIYTHTHTHKLNELNHISIKSVRQLLIQVSHNVFPTYIIKIEIYASKTV
uniref:Uncharacterized protein n=1 Tax=Anguilla anguilla TaxID=7936 RepID=A0A0E9Q4W5_ANGAN